jgi:hypothetical protein
MMLVLGFSAVAQAKTIFLQCGGISIAINLNKEELIKSNLAKKINTITEFVVELDTDSGSSSIIINRISLEYFAFISGKDESGTCHFGRKF